MYFYTLFTIIALCGWDTVNSAACNCGLGSGVNPCRGTAIIAGGGVVGGVVTTCNGDIIEDGSESGLPLVVRPQPLPTINVGTISKPRVVCKTIGGIEPLKPIGSLCSCEKAIVKPAIVPRPACSSCGILKTAAASSKIDSRYFKETISFGPGGETIQLPSGDVITIDKSGNAVQVSQNGETIQISPSGQTVKILQPSPLSLTLPAPAHLPAPAPAPLPIDLSPVALEYPICGLPVLPKPAPNVPQVPADAVSIALALKQQQQQKAIAVDGQLAFGFKTLPQELPCAAKPAAFPEEKLYKLNGQILELKASGAVAPDVDAEALAELEKIQEDEADAAAPSQISMEALGYGLASLPSSQFINVGVSHELPSAHPLPRLCNDGFVPGEVVIKGGPVNSEVVLPPSPQPVCLDNESQHHYGYSHGYSHAHSHSHSHSHAHAHASSHSVKNKLSQLLVGKLSGGCS